MDAYVFVNFGVGTQGCDASILLEDTPSFTGERTALQNNNSARGFEVIEAAKRAVEDICPGVVSCADVLAVAARDASAAVGGPSWTVRLGRRDSTDASRSLAESNLPRFTDSLSALISNFGNKGLSERDMVALSGTCHFYPLILSHLSHYYFYYLLSNCYHQLY